MKNKKIKARPRNWALVFISSILMVLGLALIVLALMNVSSFGLWGLLIGAIGLTAFGAAVTAIITNDPSWILLDLIMPF